MNVIVVFGEDRPPWTNKEKYLRILIDKKLTYLPMIKEISERVTSRGWRLFNHCSPFTGASPQVLNFIYTTWIEPAFLYGCPVWVSRVRPRFKIFYKGDFTRNYKGPFQKLNRFYLKCGRAILGVPGNTSEFSVLIRLGWLPLDYFLAYHACIWNLKSIKGDAG